MATQSTILPESFYARDTVTAARDLLGKVLVSGGMAAPIVEVEAYLGLNDKAAHAADTRDFWPSGAGVRVAGVSGPGCQE